MNGHLGALVALSRGGVPAVQPRPLTRFETPAFADPGADDAGGERTALSRNPAFEGTDSTPAPPRADSRSGTASGSEHGPLLGLSQPVLSNRKVKGSAAQASPSTRGLARPGTQLSAQALGAADLVDGALRSSDPELGQGHPEPERPERGHRTPGLLDGVRLVVKDSVVHEAAPLPSGLAEAGAELSGLAEAGAQPLARLLGPADVPDDSQRSSDPGSDRGPRQRERTSPAPERAKGELGPSQILDTDPPDVLGEPPPRLEDIPFGVLTVPPLPTQVIAAVAPMASPVSSTAGVAPHEPVVHVTIGRLEVKAAPATPARESRAAHAPKVLSLEEYGVERGRPR